jgi:hypothetical protein
MRNNVWILNDVFSNLVSIPILNTEYGQKEIENAKDWFINNNIATVLRYRKDDQFPLITIGLGSSSEVNDMKSLGDLSPEVNILMPLDIGKPIPYIVRPFSPLAFDASTSVLTIPSEINLGSVTAGMILVNPSTGVGYVITNVGAGTLTLDVSGVFSGSSYGIIPQFQFYKARRERSFFQESYQIGCHIHGDPAPLLWLDAIITYILLRYRESLLEARGFNLSSFSRGDLSPNPNYGLPETVYSRFISLTGMVENSWLKTPYRVIESVNLTSKITPSGGVAPTGLSGIFISSNLTSPDYLINTNQSWLTIEDL